MLHQAQLGQGRSKRGYTLLEIIIAVAVVCILLSMVITSYQIRVNRAKLARTVNEMMSLAQASLNFYNSQGNWPATPSDLSPTFMYTAVTFSPFGGKYQINGFNDMATISTTIPSGMAQNYYEGALLEILPGAVNDTVSISQRLPNEFAGRLEYEKKYTYQQ